MLHWPLPPATAKCVPFGENATERALRGRRSMTISACQVAVSHTRTEQSQLADNMRLPSGENAMSLTSAVWPTRIPFISNVEVSQMRIVSSALAVANMLESGEKAQERIGPLWPDSSASTPSGTGLFAFSRLVVRMYHTETAITAIALNEAIRATRRERRLILSSPNNPFKARTEGYLVKPIRLHDGQEVFCLSPSKTLESSSSPWS